MRSKDNQFTAQEEYFSCPRPEDPEHFIDCCGASCVVNFLGVVTGVVVLVGVLVLACCCCAPCCLLAKKRKQRGMVHRPPPPSSAGLLPSAGLPSSSYPVDHRQHAPLARGAPPSFPA